MMCTSQQPLDGADSEWAPRPFRVLMEGDDGDRITVRVPAAIGPRDAQNQARDLQPYYTPLRVEEAA